MAELELTERLKFLKIDDVLPAFSNVVEFVEIGNLPDYSSPTEMRIGALGGKFFVFNEVINVTKLDVVTQAQISFSKYILKFVSLTLPSSFVEKTGKFLWYRFISNLDPDSKVRRLFLTLRNSRDSRV